MNYCKFGENLKRIRKATSLTQNELGRQLGLSKAVISKYENDMGYPSYDTLIRIARYFGVTTDYLLGISTEKTADVSQLTESQIHMVNQLIAEFTKINKNNR